MKKYIASESEINKLYDSNVFYEYGDNPALKKFVEIMSENMRQGRLPNYRINFIENQTRLTLHIIKS